MTQSNDDQSFLSRWSRQKQQAKQPPISPAAATEPAAPPAEPDAPPIDLEALPKIEDLTAESDISVFLQKGVPDALKQLALRRMWSLDPQIRDFVEVAENQWDFNAVGGIHGLFEELPAGSDVSTWLAQATQSVMSDKPAPLVADASQAGGSPDISLQSQAREVASANAATHLDGQTATDAAVAEGDGELPPTLVQQVTIRPETASPRSVSYVSETSQQSATVTTSDLAPSRPRHGGALPR